MVSERATKNKSSERRSWVLEANAVQVDQDGAESFEIVANERGKIKAKDLSDFDSIDLLQEPYIAHLEIPDNDPVRNAGPLRVYSLDIARLRGTERTNRLVLLRKLSSSYARIVVHLNWEDDNGKERALRIPNWRKKDLKADLAAILILSIALRNIAGTYNKEIGELIGLAQPDTIKLMQPFYRRPLMDTSFIRSLLHGAARHLNERRAGNQNERVDNKVARQTSNVVASLLKTGLDMDPIEWFQRSIEEIFEHPDWTSDADRGTQVGLLLLGEQKFLRGRLATHRTKADTGLAVLRSVHGGLSALPLAGSVPAALEPWFEMAAIELSKRRENQYFKAWRGINEMVKDNFKTSILKDGEVKIRGRPVPVKVNKNVFNDYMNDVSEDGPEYELMGGVKGS